MVSRSDIVAEARSWLGVPWRHQGRGRRGVDCAGLVACVGLALGLTDYDTAAYARRPEGGAFLEHFRRAGRAKPLASMLPGDVLVFRGDVYPCHCGVLAERAYGRGRPVPTVVHAHALRRRVVEEPLAGEWRGRLLLCFAYPGIED